ncbi:hypothetical protein FACS1894204_01790 [Synergistales bacterium]|nr:hypothetical protein FACS1894204_01790 [Synergistales bacterium]
MFSASPVWAASTTVTLGQTGTTDTVSGIEAAIDTALSTYDTVTVTGTLSDVAEALALKIPAGKTVVWQAVYSGNEMVYVGGDGTLDISNGGKITSSGLAALASTLGTSVFVGVSGTVENTSDGTAIFVNGSAPLIVNGGTVRGKYSAIQTSGNKGAAVIIESGMVEIDGGTNANYAIHIIGTTVLAITGGTVQNTVTEKNAVWIDDNSAVFVLGGAVAEGGIKRNQYAASAAGYYTGNLAALFDTTGTDKFTTGNTTGNNLFALNGLLPKLTQSTALGAAYTYVAGAGNASLSEVVASFPSGLDITGVTSTPSVTHNFGENIVKFYETYDYSAITLDVTGTVAGRAPVSFTTAAFGVNVNAVQTGLRVNGAGPFFAVAAIKSAIESALEGSAPVTVTGTLSGVTRALTLSIPDGKTVTWQAELVGATVNPVITLVSISGGGTLDVAAGGSLKNSTYHTITVGANTTVKVSGGTVEATSIDAYAIYLNGTGAKAEVTGGEVKAVYQGIGCNSAGTIVSVSGGTVSASAGNGSAIKVSNVAATVEVSGTANVTNTAGYGINTDTGSTAVVSIKDGTVTGLNRILGGTIIVSGGAVSSTASQALILNNSANAFILGGTVSSSPSGTPIVRNSGHTGAAYYTGDRAGLFDTSSANKFTSGTNLFKLEFDAAPALTANSAPYTYDPTTPSAHPVVATLSGADKLNLSGATVTATAGNPTIDTTAKTVTFDAGVNYAAITITVTDAKITGTDIPVSFTTAAFGVNTDDITPPTLTEGTVSRTSDTAATVSFTSDEAGTYYYQVVADNAGDPNINTSGAGTACGTSEVTIINPAGLTAGARDIWIYVKDTANNVGKLKIDIPAYTATTYAVSMATNGATQNGVTATGAISPSGNQAAGTNITVTITLTGTAAAAGTHTVGLTSTAAGTIADPASVTKTVTAGQAMTAGDTFGFTFTMPANAVSDLVVTHTFSATPPPSGTAPTITTNALANGTVGAAYSEALTATGTTPITWTLDSGSLPGGLNLSSGGVISGTPTAQVTANFTVKASNGVSPEATKALSITVNATPTNALTGTATIDNTSPRIGDTLTASFVNGNNTGTLSYVWKADGAQAGTGTSYAVPPADLGKTITLEIKSSVETGTVTSAPTAAVLKKAAPLAPSAPTLDAKTHNSVTLTANALYEFSKDGAAWQTSNVFNSLNPSAAYTFYQRLAETSDTLASEASAALNVTTDAAPPTLDPLNNVTIGSNWTNLADNASGTGWTWDGTTKTLTLTGDTADEIKIASETDEITVRVTDNVNVPKIVKTGSGALKITGAAGKTLTVEDTNGPAISSDGDIYIDSGTVKANVTGTGNTEPAIKAGGNVTITGTANVVASNSGTGDAINAGGGNGAIIITGGCTEVTDQGSGTNPYPPTMSGDNTVVIVNGQIIFGDPATPNNPDNNDESGGNGGGGGCDAGTGAGTLALLALALIRRR